MNQSLLLLIFLLITSSTARPADERPPRREREVPRIDWSGTWVADQAFEKLLGIVRRQGEGGHPLQLTLAPVPDVKQSLQTDSLQEVQTQYFDRMRHTIVDTGRWTAPAEYRVREKRDSRYFITHCRGETWLWIGTPVKSYNGAKLHLIRGVSAQQDLLILNFDIFPTGPRKFANAVGYRRAARPPE